MDILILHLLYKHIRPVSYVHRIFLKLVKFLDSLRVQILSVNKEDYLFAMERSPVRSKEIKSLLQEALTDKINDRQVYMKGIDASYGYEGYSACPIEKL